MILSARTLWQRYPAVESGLLVDGRDYYLAFYEAARRARRSILLVGWQFDSDVPLVRGHDVPDGVDPHDLELLAFLDRLCRERPELEIRVLAWAHSLVFAFEREVLQKVVFDVATCKRFHFCWDDTAPLPGSHHQKVAIIDGTVAFSGSQDICQARWDDSAHAPDNPLRTERYGVHYRPCHEVQVALVGPPVRSLVELFADRWRRATGEELDVPCLVDHDGPGEPHVTLGLPRRPIGLSRTMPGASGEEAVQEVRALYTRAIESAERLIYVETQYLTSCAVRDALASRMRDRGRPTLDVVIVLPQKPEKLKEQIMVGLPQAETLGEIARVAEEHGHHFGVYNVAARSAGGEDVHVYIHSKLMIVDDRFLTVGSANLTNRSMALDSELNASWEAAPGDRDLEAAIRGVRVRLLREHLGDGDADGDGFARAGTLARIIADPAGLVARLDATIDARRGRLRRHDLHREAPSGLARAFRELACEYLDPADAVALASR